MLGHDGGGVRKPVQGGGPGRRKLHRRMGQAVRAKSRSACENGGCPSCHRRGGRCAQAARQREREGPAVPLAHPAPGQVHPLGGQGRQGRPGVQACHGRDLRGRLDRLRGRRGSPASARHHAQAGGPGAHRILRRPRDAEDRRLPAERAA